MPHEPRTHGRGPGGLLYQVKGLMMHAQGYQTDKDNHFLSTMRDMIATVNEKYKLDDIHQYRTKHVDYYVERLKAHAPAYDPHTIAGKLADVRTFARMIGKANIVKSAPEYKLPKDVRKTNEDRAWTEKEYKEILEKIGDPRIEVMMRGARWMGLRLEEASLTRPNDIHFTRAVAHVKRGTKGGRPRYVKFASVNGPQGEAWAKRHCDLAFGRDQGIIPPEYRLKSWKSKVDAAIRDAGGGRKNGLTFHGLRHTFAQELYTKLAHYPPPVKGGRPTRELHVRVSKIVAKVLGHNRWGVAETYVGTLSPAAETSPPPAPGPSLAPSPAAAPPTPTSAPAADEKAAS